MELKISTKGIKVNHTVENGFDVWDFFPEEKQRFEDGDCLKIVDSFEKERFAVFKTKNIVYFNFFKANKELINQNEYFQSSAFFFIEKIELSELNAELATIGKCWDAEQKKIVNLIWKPTKKGEKYYSLIPHFTDSSDFSEFVFASDLYDRKLIELNLCFPTEEECEKYRESLLKFTKEWRQGI